MNCHKANAWGQNGHRIIGKVAEQHLTATTKQAIMPLLENESLAQVSTWADEMRSNPAHFWQKKSSRWHYINFEPDNTFATNNKQHTHTKDSVSNILQGMQYAIATLQSDKYSIDEKRFALRFLVHLVGDSHQPFHAGRSEDRGGNNISVTFFGQDSNLHRVWDTNLIESENLSYSEFAEIINITDASLIKEYLKSNPEIWLRESYKIANSIYNKNETNISYQYVYKYLPIVKVRLQQGGIRLSGLLNLIFDNTAKPLVKALDMSANTH